MLILIAIILFLIFLFLSGLHVYWAFGGRWASQAVIPTKNDDTMVAMPGVWPTMIVAAGLLGFGLLVLIKCGLLNVILPQWLGLYGLWVVAGIFIFRAIGEFNYLGFFKHYKQTAFAKNDTKYYSPLCLLIGVLTLILQFYS